MTQVNKFDPDKDPEVRAARQEFEQLQKAEAKARRQRDELRKRAAEARSSAVEREEKAEELQRQIRASFINGRDDEAGKLRDQQEGERRRAELDRQKAETLEKEADNVESPGADPAINPNAGRTFWIRVYEACEREFREDAARLAGLAAFAYGRSGNTSISPREFADRVLTQAFPIVGQNGISLGDKDHPIPRPGVLASMLERNEEEREDVA